MYTHTYLYIYIYIHIQDAAPPVVPHVPRAGGDPHRAGLHVPRVRARGKYLYMIPITLTILVILVIVSRTRVYHALDVERG